MNYKYFLSKFIDFLFNFTVVSLAVSIYEKIWYGLAVSIICFLLGLILALRQGD